MDTNKKELIIAAMEMIKGGSNTAPCNNGGACVGVAGSKGGQKGN